MDMMLASQGGVCHIVWTDCCTYIPDISDNMTHVVSHLNDLLHDEKSKDSQTPEGWSLWSCLTGDGWKATLMKLMTPLLIVVVMFALLACCVIPCAKDMIASTVGQYVNLQEKNTSDIFPLLEWIPPFYDDVDLV